MVGSVAPAAGSAAGVAVATPPIPGVGVTEGLGVVDPLGVGVGLAEPVVVGVGVGEPPRGGSVGVAVGVGDDPFSVKEKVKLQAMGDPVGEGDGELLGVPLGLGVGLADPEGVAEGEGDGEADGVGVTTVQFVVFSEIPPQSQPCPPVQFISSCHLEQITPNPFSIDCPAASVTVACSSLSPQTLSSQQSKWYRNCTD